MPQVQKPEVKLTKQELEHLKRQYEDTLSNAWKQISFQHPFWASILLALDVVWQPNPFHTMGTDGSHLYIDPTPADFLLKNKDNVIFTLLHETLHVSLLHMLRGNDKNHQLWNIATDYAVNAYLHDMGFNVPDGALYDPQYSNMTAEEIYDKIYKKAKKNALTISISFQGKGMPMPGQGSGQESSQGQGNAQGGSGSTSGTNKKGNSKGSGGSKGKKGRGKRGTVIVIRDSHDEWGKFKNQSKEEVRKASNRVKDIVRNALRQFPNFGSTGQGTIPDAFKREFDKLYKSRIPWQQYVQSALTRAFDSGDRVSQYPSRKYTEVFKNMAKKTGNDALAKMRMWGYQREETNIAIAIDTSGSISNSDLGIFLTEVGSMLRGLSNDGTNVNGVFLSCDAEVATPMPLSVVLSQVMQGKEMNIPLTGGGGTDFRPVFEWVTKHKSEMEEPELLIYFTDGYGTFPEQKPNYPVLWVVRKESELSADDAAHFPFGTVVWYDPREYSNSQKDSGMER